MAKNNPIRWQEIYDLSAVADGDRRQGIIDALNAIEQSDIGQKLFRLYQKRQKVSPRPSEKIPVFEGEKTFTRLANPTSKDIILYFHPNEGETYYSTDQEGDIRSHTLANDAVLIHETAHFISVDHAALNSAVSQIDSYAQRAQELVIEQQRLLMDRGRMSPRMVEEFDTIKNRLFYIQNTADQYYRPDIKKGMDVFLEGLRNNVQVAANYFAAGADNPFSPVLNTLDKTIESLQATIVEKRRLQGLSEDFAIDIANQYREEKSQNIPHRQNYLATSRNYPQLNESAIQEINELNSEWEATFNSPESEVEHIKWLIQQFNKDDVLSNDEIDYIKDVAKGLKHLNIKIKQDGDTRDMVIKSVNPSNGERTKGVLNDIDSIKYPTL